MNRIHLSSGAPWESVGYSRAVRCGDLIQVTGTVATFAGGHCEGDAAAETRQIMHNLQASLQALDASLADIVRTRIYVTDIARDWEAIGREHCLALGTHRPATTMVEVRKLIEPWALLEIEANAQVGDFSVEYRSVTFTELG